MIADGVEGLWDRLRWIIEEMGAELDAPFAIERLQAAGELADVSATLRIEGDDEPTELVIVLALAEDTAVELGRALSGRPDLQPGDPMIGDVVAELANILVGASGHPRFSVPEAAYAHGHVLASIDGKEVERGRSRADEVRLYQA